jgi:ribonucleases P/MRP protein subunit RPP40
MLGESRHGFRNKKSCLTNLLEFKESTASMLDVGTPVDVIFLDFQKAFDKVPHGRLLVKLRDHGIDGKVLEWIKQWLRGRRQRVVVNGKHSR